MQHMDRRHFIRTLSILPAAPFVLKGTAIDAPPVRKMLPAWADLDYHNFTMAASEYLNNSMIVAWNRVCRLPGLLPIVTPPGKPGRPAEFHAEDMQSVEDYSKCPTNCTREHAPLYWNRGMPFLYVLVLRRVISDKYFVDVDEARVHPSLFTDWVERAAGELATEMRNRTMVHATHDVSVGCNLLLSPMKVSSIIAEVPKVFVKREAFLLEMFAYTTFGLATTVEQLKVEYP